MFLVLVSSSWSPPAYTPIPIPLVTFSVSGSQKREGKWGSGLQREHHAKIYTVEIQVYELHWKDHDI